jgi:electron transport complex protein RnfE
VIPGYRGFLLDILPPGGFLALGFLLAGKRILEKKLRERSRVVRPVAVSEPGANA